MGFNDFDIDNDNPHINIQELETVFASNQFIKGFHAKPKVMFPFLLNLYCAENLQSVDSR